MHLDLSPTSSLTILPGGVLLRLDGRWVLIDAGAGVDRALPDDPATHLHALLLSSGSMSDLAGLIPLLARRSLGSAPLLVCTPLATDRPGLLIEAWQRGWPDHLELILDGVYPGAEIEIGRAKLRAVGLERPEDHPGAPGPKASAPCLGWSATCGRHRIAIARAGAPGRNLDRLIVGADAAVLGSASPQPTLKGRPLALRREQAERYRESVKTLILLDSDGQPCPPAPKSSPTGCG